MTHRMGMEGTKWRIFESSVFLFAEKSYHNVSIREIAQDVGIRPGSIYNHFDSKEEILGEVYRYYMLYIQSMTPDLEDLLTAVEKEHPFNVLKRIAEISYDPGIDELLSQVYLIILSQITSDPAARDVLNKAIIEPNQVYFTEVFNRMLELGIVEDVDIESFTFIYTSMCYYISMEYLFTKRHPEDFWNKALESLFSLIKLKNPPIK